jgi:hypothetical protein
MGHWVDTAISVLKSKEIGERIANVVKAPKS